MKVLFLDIDGVLNRDGTTERCNFYTGVDRVLSERLLSWLKGRDISIVLSSTWRNFPEMHDHLSEAGITWVGVTPDHRTRPYPRPRGGEIKEYLDNNTGITHYGILDDATDMLPEQLSRFVNTDPSVGVQDSDLEKLSQLF